MTSEAYCSISRSRRSLRRSTMISPTSRRSRARPSSWPATRSEATVRGDGASSAATTAASRAGAARRQRDEHERLGRRDAEGRVQQRRAGAARRCPCSRSGNSASSAASRKVARPRGRRWPGRRCRRGRRRCARRGCRAGPAGRRQRSARRRVRRRGPRHRPAQPVALRSTCSRRRARRSRPSRLTMRSRARVKSIDRAAAGRRRPWSTSSPTGWVSDEHGGDQAGEAEQHDEAPRRGEPGAAGAPAGSAIVGCMDGEHEQRGAERTSRREQAGPVGDVGGEPRRRSRDPSPAITRRAATSRLPTTAKPSRASDAEHEQVRRAGRRRRTVDCAAGRAVVVEHRRR